MITLFFSIVFLSSPPTADVGRLAACGQVCRAGLIPIDGKTGAAEVCTACAPMLPACPALAVCGAVDESAFQACAELWLLQAPPGLDADGQRAWLAAWLHRPFRAGDETPALLGEGAFEERQAAVQAGLAAGTLTEASVQAALAARCLALKLRPAAPRYGQP
ncbi:MAG: hypothetical protein R3F60_05990 [bacterium]